MLTPKLPLLVRKDIRDEFENNQEFLAEKFKKLLGEDYKFEVNFLTLYTHAEGDYQLGRIGTLVRTAIEDCASRIDNGTNSGEEKILVDGFNDAVPERIITVVADPDFNASYCGCRVTNGVFEIVFKPKNLGTNSYDACEYWMKAIDEAASKANPKGLPPTAKSSIKTDFEDKKVELEKVISKHLGGEKLTLHADFEDIWAKIIDGFEALPANKKNDLDLDHLKRRIGDSTFNYFDSLRDKLDRELQGDDMMIEGFFDQVSTKEAWFGLIPESEALKGSYTDTTIEDGKLWSRSKPTKFDINVYTGFEGLSKLL